MIRKSYIMSDIFSAITLTFIVFWGGKIYDYDVSM